MFQYATCARALRAFGTCIFSPHFRGVFVVTNLTFHFVIQGIALTLDKINRNHHIWLRLEDLLPYLYS
jgi:hypothetical protein